jgi:hypothetical protein
MWEPRRLTTLWASTASYLSKLDTQLLGGGGGMRPHSKPLSVLYGCEMIRINWNLCPGTRFSIIWEEIFGRYQGDGYVRVSVARLMICWHLLRRRRHVTKSVTNKVICCWFFCQRDMLIFLSAQRWHVGNPVTKEMMMLAVLPVGLYFCGYVARKMAWSWFCYHRNVYVKYLHYQEAVLQWNTRVPCCFA